MSVVRMLRRLHMRKLKRELKKGKVTEAEIALVQGMTDEEFKEFAEKSVQRWKR